MVERTPIQLGRLDLRQLGIEWIEAGAGPSVSTDLMLAGVCRRTIWIVSTPPRLRPLAAYRRIAVAADDDRILDALLGAGLPAQRWSWVEALGMGLVLDGSAIVAGAML